MVGALKERGQLVGWDCCYLPLIGCPQWTLDCETRPKAKIVRT